MKHRIKNTTYIIVLVLILVMIIGCRNTSDQKEDQETKETLPVAEETKAEEETDESKQIDQEEETEPDKETDDEEETEPTKETDDGQETNANVYGKATDYLSFEANTRYHFEGQGNEYATFDVYVDYISKDAVQYRTNNGGTELIEVIKKNNDNITRNIFKGEVYYRENLTSKEDSDKDIILKDPVKVGNSWTLADGSKREITGVEVSIETPTGTYSTVEVTTLTDNVKVQEYFAKDIGLVRRMYLDDDLTITSTLSKKEKDVPLIQNIRFFYPDKDLGKIIYDDRQVSFKTNDITKLVLEREYKKIQEDEAYLTIPTNANILSLYLNKDGAVYIDFTKELISEMNAGAGGESLILQSIVNTFANYYGVKKVYLTVDNKPYESGHIVLEKGEKLELDMEKVID